MVQQLNNLVAHSFGVYKTDVVLPDGSTVYYMHDKPTLAESMKIWKQTADAFAVSTDGGVTYTAGFDVNGNAVVNVLSAIGINADWMRTGSITSPDGRIAIDLTNGTFILKDSAGEALITSNGVANSDNFNATDNVANGYPLRMPFNIDDSVSVISKVLLKYTIDKFRTYSTGASAGGGVSESSGLGGFINVQSTSVSISGNTDTEYGASLNTGSTTATAGESHNHSYSVPGHAHTVSLGSHSHSVQTVNHSHEITIDPHTHGIEYGILETSVTDNKIEIYVDGTLRATTLSTDTQGAIDLTAWVTTVGWHAIELKSTTLKRISAQVNVKSYIRN
jgi:hypothetical protein